MDPKEKNKQTSANQREKLQKRQHEVQSEQKIENMSPSKLRSKLSNKNSDYVFHLQKELERQGKLTADQAKNMVDHLLKNIVVEQHKGTPANSLFKASPKIKAHQLLHPAVKPKKTPTWQRLIDAILIYVAIMTGLFGVLDLFQNPKQNSNNSQMGIVSLLLVGILLGAVMTRYNDLLNPGRNARGNVAKLILYGLAIFIGLVVIMYIFQSPALRPINPVLPASADIAIAVIAYLARFFFRRYYHITSSPFYPQGRRSKSK